MKRSEVVRKIRKYVMRAVARSIRMLLLPLFFCLVLECVASAKGKAYVAVFYRTFEDSEDSETAKIRAALNEALADAGIMYQEYDGKNDPSMQLTQIAQEKDAMLLIVNPAEQSSEDIGENNVADIVMQTDGRPLIFFGCEIGKETVDMAEDLCVLVNAAEPRAEAETETEITGAEIIAADFSSETEMEQGTETETEGQSRAEIGTEINTEDENGLQEKNIQGVADAIALIAGNYMTGAGYFEGIEEDWVTGGWRVDVEY